jgi:O-antigen/teichoic acid export membrane protein
MLPLTYILTKQHGIIGPPIANLISISIYNGIRLVFLWKRFKLFPFSIRSGYTLLLAGGSYVICYFLFVNMHGLAGLILRSLLFITLYAIGVMVLRLSPDTRPVLQTISKRLKPGKD